MKKFYSEICYVLGIMLLGLGLSMMTKADFGLSMVVAPAYILHLKMSEFWSFFSFGMAEYVFQAFLLVLVIVAVRKFKLSYLLSFVTAVIYGFVLDGGIALMSLIGDVGIAVRVVLYVVGMLLTGTGVSFMFHTYISPEVYELFVKEVAEKFGFKIHNVKTIYDCASCLVAIIMTFCFFGFGNFRGINWGTIICAVVNGKIIGFMSNFLEKRFEFVDRFNLRKYF